MTTDAIRLERNGDVAWIRIDRPATRNAMSAPMWLALGTCVDAIARDASVRAVVLCGNAGAFVSGADIADFASLASADDALAYEDAVEATLRGIERLDVVTIAAVSGACTGGGAVLASACDLRIGTSDARVGVPIARTVGNMTTARNVARLVAVVGQARARAWIVTAELSDAAHAERAGFFCELADGYDALLARAQALAERVAANAPLTIAGAKELLRRAGAVPPDPSDRDVLARCYGSDDFREGVAAFVAKRPARFTGR